MINEKNYCRCCDSVIYLKYKEGLRKELESFKSLRTKMSDYLSPKTESAINNLLSRMTRIADSEGCISDMEDPKLICALSDKVAKLIKIDMKRHNSFLGRIKALYSYYFSNSKTTNNRGINCKNKDDHLS